MKNLFYFLLILLCCCSCEAQENETISEMKINVFRASDSVRVSPVMLKMELMSAVDTSFIKYVFCSDIDKQPHKFTNKDLQFGLYVIQAYWEDIDDYRILNFEPNENYEINLYLDKDVVEYNAIK